MSKKITVPVHITGEVNDLQQKLSSLKTDLKGLLESGKAPKGLEQTLTKLGNLLGTIQDKASRPIDTKAGFGSLSKDVGNAEVMFNTLVRTLHELKNTSDDVKLELLTDADKAKLTAGLAELEKYKKALEAIAKTEKDLANAEKADKKAQKEVTKNSDAVKRTKGKIDSKTTEKKEVEAKIAKLGAEPEKNAEQLERLREKASALQKQIKELNEELKGQKEALSSSQSVADGTSAKVDTLTQSVNNQKTALVSNRQAAEALGVAIEGVEGKTTAEELEQLTTATKEFKDSILSGAEPALDKMAAGLDDVSDVANSAQKEIDESTDKFEKLTEAASEQSAFENKIKSFLGLKGAAHVMRAALRDAMQTIKELDATMTEMAVVTDLSVGDYWDQLPEYSQRASELGVSINSAYKAATLYYQQGLKTEEVTAISTETLKMAKIAGMDAADATDKMTAALRGFNMELNEASAQKISDVYSELAAITAASTQEIANAMTKTASIASSAGMEFETTAAFLSQIIETTRESAETAGTAMKTVIARFQELKKAPEDIGEIDGEIVDANAIETALRSVGVSLRNANGQFRELDDVFLELSSKWDGLDKNTQRYIATIAAGSRQQSRFIAMMSNYNRTQDLVTAANNSAGASNEQFEKTMESLEAKVEKLKNAWHEFTMGIMNSDFVKAGVDILTKFLEVLNKATSAFNGLGGSIAKIGSILAIFKLGQKIFNKFRPMVVKFFGDIIREAYDSGEKSAQAFEQGAKKGKNGEETKKNVKLPKGYKYDANGKLHNEKGQFVSEEERKRIENPGLKDKIVGGIKSKTGVDDLKTGVAGLQKITQARKDTTNAQKNLNDLKARKASMEGATKKELAEMEAQIKDAESSLKRFQKAQVEAEKGGKEAWGNIASGVGKAGQAISAVGVGVSMFGGLLQSLGLEKAGEAVAGFGNALMIVGTVISTLVPLVSLLGKTVTIAGTEMSIAGYLAKGAWWWVLLIVAGIAILVGAVIAIFKQIENNSPEKKLEKAAKNAEEAAKGAELAAEKYDKLNNAFTELESKEDALDGLIKGTKEWNDAVQEMNSSVLDLINEYAELGSLVQNEGGVLKIDTDSEEVQAVLNKYKANKVAAQGANIGAQAELSKQKNEYELSQMDSKVFNKFKSNSGAGAAWGNLFAATGAGAAAGAGIGAGIGGIAGTVVPVAGNAIGAAGGAGIGALAGAITGLVAGIATFKYSMDQSAKKDEQNRQNVKDIAEAFAKGEAGTTKEEISDYIERNGIAFGRAADKMAQSVLDNADTMKEYGDSLVKMNEAQKAYYQAMATNAQQLINLGQYTEKEIDQMTSVVDEDLMKQFEDQAKAELQEGAKGSDSKEYKQSKEDYAKQVYGDKATVKGNKILDEKGEVVREFEDDESFINEMASAQATLKAAEAMEQVPGIINSTIKTLTKETAVIGENLKDGAAAIEKAFSNANSMTKSELETFKASMGGAVVKDKNAVKEWESLSADQKAEYGSLENYAKANAVDVDYTGLEKAFGELTAEQKKIYGLEKKEGDKGYKEQYEKAYEAYEATFTEISNSVTEQFSKAEMAAEKLGITLSGSMSAANATAWTSGLQEVAPGGGDVSGLNTMLSDMLSQLTIEDADKVMSQINAIDKMDRAAWDGLADTFEQLGISIPTDELNAFIEKGKEASNAIEKINFGTLAQDINDIYKLVNSAQSGNRTYSEEQYKEFVNANASLKSDFMQIGDEFIYMGGSIDNLVNALEENTAAKMEEANRLLASKAEMASILEANAGNYASVSAMDTGDQAAYISEMRQAFAEQGRDISDFGIAGLSLSTDLNVANADQIDTWANALAAEIGNAFAYANTYADNMKQANIVQYASKNTATQNANLAAQGGANADQFRSALMLQAVQSGGVSDALIEQYSTAIAENNTAEMDRLGKIIADSTELIVEDDDNRKAFEDLTDRLTEALYDSQQKQIDALSNINDGINEARSNLVSKIQEQINEQREQRENDKARKNISDLQSQRAMLAMQTGDGNALDMLSLDENIAEAEQSYQDSMVDQALQNLEDSNEEAAEQRERQIKIMQSQLDYAKDSGMLANQAAEIAKTSVADIQNGIAPLETAMGQLLWDSEGGGLGGLAKETWVSELSKASVAAEKYLTKEEKAAEAEASANDFSASATPTGPIDVTAPELVQQNPEQAAAQLEVVKSGFRKFFTEDIPNWWNNNIAPFFTGEFWAEKWAAITAWWDSTVAPIFTGEFWAEKFFAMGQAIGNFIVKIGEIFQSIKSALGEAWSAVVNFFTVTVVNWWNKNIAPIFTKEFWQQKWDTIKEGLSQAWQSFTAFFTETIPAWWNEHIAPIFTKEFWATKWNSFVDGLKEAWNKVKAWWDEHIAPIFTKEYWKALVDKIGEGLKSGFEAAINAVIKGINSALKKLADIYNNSIGSFIAGIASVFGGKDVGKITYKEIGLVKFEEGGLANFTGPAWLDGTPSKPEYILNADQTERFFALIDVLEDVDLDKEGTGGSGGDNYYNIEIAVDSIENDYDVEKMAEKIRSMIYDDASYRNVNAISFAR